MAKNVLSLQLLRNSTVFTTKELAIAGITSASTQDGVIKLARYTEDNKTKTIFGIYHDFGSGNAGYTIYDSYQEAIAAMQDQINAISAATSGASITLKDVQDMLGTGVTTDNSVTEQLQALSGNSGTAQSGDTSVEGAKAYAADKIAEEIDKLDVTDTAVAGQYVSQVSENDGKIAVTRADVSAAVLNNYTKGSDSGDVASTDTINQAISKLENKIIAAGGDADAKLGTGVTTANTATQQFEALRGTTADTSASTSVAGAKAYADEKISQAVDGLDYTDTAATGSYVSEVNEANGVISVSRVALPTVSAISGAGKPITAVSESLGSISATAGTINAEYVNVADADGNFTASTVEGVLAEIKSGYTAADTALKSEILGGASASADTLGELEALINNISAEAKEYHIVKTTSDLPATVKERYSLQDADNHVSGDTIDIPKDSHIVSITYITGSTDPHYQNLEYVYIDASGNTQTEYVDISGLVLEAEFASGVTVTNHVAHGVVDPTSEEDSSNNAFLTVGENGFKIQGIKAEINNAVSGATAQTAALSAKTVTEIASSNSSISATTSTADNGTVSVDLVTDASKVKMTGFTADASGFSAITTASTVTEAVKAIETEFLANEATVSAALNDLKATKVENIVVNGVTGTFSDKVASVTIDGNDVVLGSDYQKPAQGDAITTADTVDKALGKLEAKVDAAVAGGVTSVSGGSGITVDSTTTTQPIVSVDLKADDGSGDNDWHNPLKFDATDQSLYFDSLDCGFYN